MIRVIKAPPLKFTCRFCKAENEGDPEDFIARHTMPPSFVAKCGFCRTDNVCFPTALIARVANGVG